jgi:small-conductance mechanosensitive channel
MASKSEVHRERLKLGDVDFIAKFSTAFGWVANVAAQIGSLALVALWVIFILNQFPETQRWGAAASAALFNALVGFERGLLRAIPGVVAVVLIVIGGRFASKLATDVFAGIEGGTIGLPGVHPETAGATRRLVITLIWLFAIIVAYPLVPGSDSVAFKGVSVFIGLIVTLGSSGVVGHIMSGLVLVYSRALKPGDLVRVGDIEGQVIEVGALSVKLVNVKKEEFTIPNTVLVSTTVTNFSRQVRESGGPLTVKVGIGYDAPWRVVNEILLEAAARTPGVRKEPAPTVYQSRLGDFAVEYQLVVVADRPDRRFATLSELHQNVQDAFNERGVQIMTPAFESQPEQPVLVPKAKWNRAPGDTPDRGERA